MAFGDLVQSPVSAGQNGVTSITITISAATVGSLLVCCHFTGDGNSIAPTNFNEAVAVTNVGSADQAAIYWKIAVGGETSIAPGSGASDENMATVLEFEGPWNVSPVDVYTTDGPATQTTTSTGTTGTTAVANEVAVGLAALRLVSGGWSGSWTNSFTQRGNPNSTNAKSMACASRVLTATGAIETATTHSSGVGMGCIATFKQLSLATALTIPNLSTDIRSFRPRPFGPGAQR